MRYVRNITDVDDKTIRRAREESRPLAEVTKQWTDKFHADCAALNCLPLDPGIEPTATGHIREQVDMIEVLMRKGHAYRAADGSVYFKVDSFPGLRRALASQGARAPTRLRARRQAADRRRRREGGRQRFRALEGLEAQRTATSSGPARPAPPRADQAGTSSAAP